MIFDTTYVEFGDGDVIQHAGIDESGKPVVLMQHTNKPKEPGAKIEPLPDDFYERPDVVLSFKDIPALDRFIEYLKGLKKYAEEQENDSCPNENNGS